MKTEPELKKSGFTISGVDRYQKAATDFSSKLFEKCIVLGERDKASDMDREITHEHVREAAAELQRKGRSGLSTKQIVCQILEYVATAIAGAATGILDKPVGVLIFVISVAIGVILFVVRTQVDRVL